MYQHLHYGIHGQSRILSPNHLQSAIELLKRINPDFTPCDNGHYTQLPQSWSLAPMQTLCSLVDGEKRNGIERTNLDVKYLRGEREAKTLTSGKYVAANSLLILVDGEKIIEIQLERLRTFKNHPFKVRMDPEMIRLSASVEKYGIINPLIVRPIQEQENCSS